MKQILAEIEAGTIKFNSSEAHRCLEAFSQDCISDVAPAACEQILEGTKPPGESCFINKECAGDAFCSNQQIRNCEPGVCVESAGKLGLGEVCGFADDSTCEEGLFCPSHLVINPNYCILRQPIGSECVGTFCELAHTAIFVKTRTESANHSLPLVRTVSRTA